MSLITGNRYSPLQDDDEEVIDKKPQTTQSNGWQDDLLLPTSTSGELTNGATEAPPKEA
jgi:hypothetical protein